MTKKIGYLAEINYNASDIFVKEYPDNKNIEMIISKDLSELNNSEDYFEGTYKEIYEITDKNLFKFGFEKDNKFYMYGDEFFFRMKTPEENKNKLESRMETLMEQIGDLFEDDGKINIDMKRYLTTVIDNHIKLDRYDDTLVYYYNLIKPKLGLLTIDNIKFKLTTNELKELNKLLDIIVHRKLFYHSKEEEQLKKFLDSVDDMTFAEKEKGSLEQIELLGYDREEFENVSLRDRLVFLQEKMEIM